MGIYLCEKAATVRNTNQTLAPPIAFTAFRPPASPAIFGKPPLVLKRAFGRTLDAERASHRIQTLLWYQLMASSALLVAHFCFLVGLRGVATGAGLLSEGDSDASNSCRA